MTTGRPSKVALQPAASRSSSTTRFFSPDDDARWTSNFMAGGPVAGVGLRASSERAGPKTEWAEKHGGPLGLPATLQQRWRRRHKRNFPPDFPSRETRPSAIGRARL